MLRCGRQARHRFDMAKHARTLQVCHMTGEDYLQAHRNHAQYMLQQQREWICLQNMMTHTCQQKETMHLHATKTTRQTLYLIRKWVREEWDPTVREVPLQPLPKRHEAHWDPKTSGKYPFTHTLQHQPETMGGGGGSPELSSVCTPWLCQNLYLALSLPQRLTALSSLTYLIKQKMLSCAEHSEHSSRIEILHIKHQK